jgi:hypothetical protein
MYLLISCMWVYCQCLQTHQKRTSDPLQRVMSHCVVAGSRTQDLWKPVLLTTELSLQAHKLLLQFYIFNLNEYFVCVYGCTQMYSVPMRLKQGIASSKPGVTNEPPRVSSAKAANTEPTLHPHNYKLLAQTLVSKISLANYLKKCPGSWLSGYNACH